MTRLGECMDGIFIFLDEKKEEIVYKTTRLPIKEAIDAFASGLDRVDIREDLTFTRNNGFVTYGCMTLREETINHLIKLSWKQLKEFNKVGKTREKQN